MAAHFSILAWRIPWTEEPGGLQSIGSQESDMTYRLKPPATKPEACGAVTWGWETRCDLREGGGQVEDSGGAGRPGRPVLHAHSCSVPQVWLCEALQLLGHPALPYSQGSSTATVRLQASLPAQKHQLLGGVHHRPSAIPHDAARGQEEGAVAGLPCLLWAREAAGWETGPGGGRVPPAVPGPARARPRLPAPLPGGNGAQRGTQAGRDPEEEGAAPLFLEALQLPREGGAEKASCSAEAPGRHCRYSQSPQAEGQQEDPQVHSGASPRGQTPG